MHMWHDKNIQLKLEKFENYVRTKALYRKKELIKNFNNTNNIIIWKQDKGRAVVILNCWNYVELCFNIPDSDQFKS